MPLSDQAREDIQTIARWYALVFLQGGLPAATAAAPLVATMTSNVVKKEAAT